MKTEDPNNLLQKPQGVTVRRLVRWKQCDGYQEAKGLECTITIERRPPYCDRGNYLAKVCPTGTLATDVDGHDGWPRYYFDYDRAILEIEAWLEKRGQLLPPNDGLKP